MIFEFILNCLSGGAMKLSIISLYLKLFKSC